MTFARQLLPSAQQIFLLLFILYPIFRYLLICKEYFCHNRYLDLCNIQIVLIDTYSPIRKVAKKFKYSLEILDKW